MQIIHPIAAIRQAVAHHNDVVLVPTMGNLHEGHLSLVHTAKRYGKTVVVSIFVNPIQFGPSEDFERYPRTLAADCEKLAAASVDIVFAPDVSELYPIEQTCFVEPTQQANLFEGQMRPGHFRGVATVVLKLFNIVQPKTAVFGKKDYQQLKVIESMVAQLNLPITLVGVNTTRNLDGLALSSRNAYLSETERAEAPRLYQVLTAIKEKILSDETNYDEMTSNAIEHLCANGWKPDYIAVRSQNQLELPTLPHEPLVVLAAAMLGNTRLIDNIEL